MNPQLTYLKRAVHILGGQKAMAKLLGKQQGHVWWWLNESKKVPPEYCLTIEKATNGQVTRYQLRPDVFGDDPVATSDQAA